MKNITTKLVMNAPARLATVAIGGEALKCSGIFLMSVKGMRSMLPKSMNITLQLSLLVLMFKARYHKSSNKFYKHRKIKYL